MVEKVRISPERTNKPALYPVVETGLRLDKNLAKFTDSKNVSKVIKLQYAGLLAKVVNKFAKRGKNSKGEENLVKALKKVDLSIKKSKGVLEASKALILAKVKMSGEISDKRNPVLSNKVENTITGTKLSLSSNNLTSNQIKGKSEGRSKINTNLPSGIGLLANIIQKAKPLVRLKKVRVAGITHQKPIPLTKKQAETEAIKRILLNAITRSEKSASVRLAKELEEIYNLSVSNKTLTEIRELHKAADANKANLGLK